MSPLDLARCVWSRWLRQVRSPGKPARRPARPGVERLEERVVPATITFPSIRGLVSGSTLLAPTPPPPSTPVRPVLPPPRVPAGPPPAVPVFGLSTDHDTAPLGDSTTAFARVSVVGTTSPGAVVSLGGAPTTADATGRFALHDVALPLGNTAVTAYAALNGKVTTHTTILSRTPVPGGVALLRDDGAFLRETTVAVDLGQAQGTRTLRFTLKAAFSRADNAASGDALLVSLVDPADPNQTLLSSGSPGTPLLTLTESGAEFSPGLVRYDGHVVEIDVTSVTNKPRGLLRFGLLGADLDGGSEVHIGPVENLLDPNGEPGPRLDLQRAALLAPGPAVALAGYAPLSDVRLLVENVWFDKVKGHYVADLRLRNDGAAALSQNVIVMMHGLPINVYLLGPSGYHPGGIPYLNFQGAIGAGGLGRGETSAAIRVNVLDPLLLRFALRPQVFGSLNAAPRLAALGTQTVNVGDHVEIKLGGADANGDPITYSLRGNALPSGELRPDGTLVLRPRPQDVGTYTFLVTASDGATEVSQPVTLRVVADANTSTRVSGRVLGTDNQPLRNMRVEIGAVQALTRDDGSFLLDLGPGVPASLTLRVRGELFGTPGTYPFIAEKLALMLEHDVYPGENNVVGRPIFLPVLDVAGGTRIDPARDTTATSASVPGASVFVRAGTLRTTTGQPFAGVLSITEVPANMTPAALPAGLRPDLVVTIQPGEMSFSTPAPLTMPNRAGWAPGTVMDLWSINPSTGEFEDVGDMRVSADGRSIVTTSGGIRNSSWHFPAPPPPRPKDPRDDKREKDDQCDECEAKASGNSEVELHSGALREMHSLVSYQSQGQTRGVTLYYDSLRADPRPIIHFGYANVVANANQRLAAKVMVRQGAMQVQLPGSASGEHYWMVDRSGDVSAALQLNFRDLPTGVYEYDLTTGLMQLTTGRLSGSTTTQSRKVQVVNTRGGGFGHGWGVGGLKQIVGNADGSLLLVDGDGGELTFAAPAAAGGPFRSPPGDFSTLQRQADGTFRRTFKDQSVELYDRGGRLVSMTDRNRNTTRYEYNPFGISRIIDPVGLATTFVYTGSNVTRIVDPANRVTTLGYDARGNLVRVTDPDGATRNWEYDDDSRLTGETDARGNREQTFYNAGGRVVRSILKDGREMHYEPVQTQHLRAPALTSSLSAAPGLFAGGDPRATYTDANGNVMELVLDKAGQMVSGRNSGGQLPAVTRNAQNLVTENRDGRNFTTEFVYDSRGNATSVSDFVGSAQGGSIFITGHDSDDHANGDYQRAGLDFLIFGRAASRPSEIAARATTRVGYLGNGDASQSGAAVSGYTNRTFIDLDNANWADEAFSGRYDVLMIGTGGDYVFTTGSARLNAAADRFRDFFNGGGGLYVNTDQGSVGQSFYNFLPRFGATQAAIGGQGVYSVTTAGLAIGLTEAIVDRDVTHTEYKNVDTGVFSVFETHNQTNDPVAIGLSRGIIGEGGFAKVTRKVEYDPTFSQVTRFVDERDKETHTDIDPGTGNVRSMRRVVGKVDTPQNGETDDLLTRYTYIASGQIDTMTDALGRVTDYDYNVFGWLLSVTYARGTADQAVMRYSYDAAGNQTMMTDPLGRVTVYAYDAMNRLLRTVEPDPDGAGPLASPVTHYGYDRAGNLTVMVDAKGNVTRNSYDERHRLVSTTQPDPDGSGPLTAPLTRYAYDKAGNLETVTDPLGQIVTHRYDSRNRRVATIDPDGGITRFAYDLDDNLTKVTDPTGNLTTFVYDSRDRLVREKDPLGKDTVYVYDGADNLRAKTDRNGRKTEYEYDDLNRLVKETWVVPGQPAANVINYGYDKVGNLLSVRDAGSALTMTYDARDRLRTVSNAGTAGAPTVLLGYGYDAASNVQVVVDAINSVVSGVNSYQYDGLDRLTRLTQTGAAVASKRVDFAYNALGQYTGIFRYADAAGARNVVNTASTYDGMNRLSSLVHSRGATPVAGYGYAYDADSRITRISSFDGVADYSYDRRDQLTGVNATSGANELYRYDANGNRLESQRHGTGYKTDPNTGNRLKTDGTFNYEYDAEGNLVKQTRITTGQVREFTWDYRNRLTRVTDKSAGGVITNEATFAYDALNRRIAKTAGGVTTRYVYDREDVLLDFTDPDGNGPIPATLAVRYLHGPDIDQVLAEDRGAGNVRWLLTDHLGTVRDVVSNAGLLLNHIRYDSFGAVLSQTNAAFGTRYLYTGREFDTETGLYYYRARYYDAAVGRFIGEDPMPRLTVLLGSPRWENLYGYVANTPTRFSDPSGYGHGGGPWHPPVGVSVGCTSADSCSTIMGKMGLLERMINSHQGWDWYAPPGRGGGRHAPEIADLWRAYAKCQSLYIAKKCDKPEKEEEEKEPACGDNCKKVLTVVGVGGAAYIGYRCIRMIPSLFPPLWWTIPANAAAP